MTPLINLVKLRAGCYDSPRRFKRVNCDVRPRSSSLWTVESDPRSHETYRWQFTRKGRNAEHSGWSCPRPLAVEYCHTCVDARRLSNPENLVRKSTDSRKSLEEETKLKLKPLTWRKRICRVVSRSYLLESSKIKEDKSTVRLSRCIDSSRILPSSWISRAYTSGYGSYPNTAPAMQSGYAISCRLTVSQRQVVPGETVTARLTLFVEDPFALVLATTAGSIGSDNFQWCALFNGPCSKQSRRMWSPLARAFVSYFLEDSYKRQVNGADRYVSSVWWKSVIKRPYRIFLVLRQVILLNDNPIQIILHVMNSYLAIVVCYLSPLPAAYSAPLMKFEIIVNRNHNEEILKTMCTNQVTRTTLIWVILSVCLLSKHKLYSVAS